MRHREMSFSAKINVQRTTRTSRRHGVASFLRFLSIAWHPARTFGNIRFMGESTLIVI
jgi:hypothetical protein